MADKAKLIKEAQKYLSKGQIDKAITSWEKVASAYPEGNTFNFIGDLHLKKGDNKAAAEQFHKAAKIYINEGFSLKGLAIYKKVLNANPHDSGALIALGELNEEKKITTDAIKYYLAAADVLGKEKKRNELLKVYQRILKLAPSNIQLKTKIADLFSKEGFVKEASELFADLGRLHEEKGDTDKATAYLMKSVEYMPNNKAALLALSTLAEKSGDLGKAVDYTSAAIERLGEDAELLLRSAHLLMAKGSQEEASNCIRKAVEIDPNNIDAKKQLTYLYLKTGEKDKAWQECAPVIDVMTKEDKLDEAASILDNFKDVEPVESRKKLVSVHKKAGNSELALNELVALSIIFGKKEMQTEQLECLKEAAEIQPENAEIRNKIDEIQARVAAPEQAAKETVSTPMGSLESTSLAGQAAEESTSETVSTPMESLESTSLAGQAAEESTSETVSTPMESFESTSLAGQAAESVSEPQETQTARQAPPPQEKTVDDVLMEASASIKQGLLDEAKQLLEGLRMKEPENIDVHLKLKYLHMLKKDIDQAVTECIIISTLFERANDKENQKAYLKEAFRLNPDDPRLEGKLEQAGIKIPQPETAPAGPETVETPSVERTAAPAEPPAPEMEPTDGKECQEPQLDSDVLEIFD
jgi:tetratricopeptide (TPR) repeat protein